MFDIGFTSVRIQISPWKYLYDIFDLNLNFTKLTGLLLLEMICVCSLMFFNDESNTNVIRCQDSHGITNGYCMGSCSPTDAHKCFYLLRRILSVRYRHIALFKDFRKRYYDYIMYLLKRIII